jgi:hypothetical protein
MGEQDARTGGCLCGAVRFSATLAKPEIDACHCGMCRRWSGGVFLSVPASTLSVDNEDALGIFASSDYGERVFCRHCGTSLFWRMRDGSHAVVSMQALDDQSGLTFVEEIFIDDKPAAYAFANPTRKLTGAQFMEKVAEQTGG